MATLNSEDLVPYLTRHRLAEMRSIPVRLRSTMGDRLPGA